MRDPCIEKLSRLMKAAFRLYLVETREQCADFRDWLGSFDVWVFLCAPTLASSLASSENRTGLFLRGDGIMSKIEIKNLIAFAISFRKVPNEIAKSCRLES